MKKKLPEIFVFLLMILSLNLVGQGGIKGTIKGNDGSPLIGVSVLVNPGSQGAVTDVDGNYEVALNPGRYSVTYTYTGYKELVNNVTIGSEMVMSDVTMAEGLALDDVVVVGSRSPQRSYTSTPLPIDVLSAKSLMSTGQTTFDKALQYRVPSFNTVQTPVNDATSILDPYEIRNMGPSRTLILINGKRKNMSSLVYVQTSPGRGETGADISAIPTDAIERVEILRDGAAAQYGSDAIAGVINIIMKKRTNDGALTFRGGVTGKGDGENYGLAYNNGVKVGENGFLNYTIDVSKVGLANRPGVVDADGEFNYWGGKAVGVNTLADIKKFLSVRPDAGNINGSPETSAAKFAINGGSKTSENGELYYNAAYVTKKVNSFANYRTPYWRAATDFPYLPNLFGTGSLASYQGYVPTFEGNLNDYNATLGYKYSINGWNTDASLTTGGNQQNYTVGNSQNRSTDAAGKFLYANGTNYTGPISFNPGGVGFTHYVGNLDVNKQLTEKFSIGFGSEVRTETFEVRAGDEASFVGVGSDSYQGNTPENSGKFNRFNIGFYGDLSYDLSKNFLVNGTVRYEDYSDFGSAAVWKVSSRYNLAGEKVTLRGSVSTGFRAPTLHQIYTQKTQSSFAAGGIILEGIVNNVSSSARRYGVPQLKAERSNNITIGVGLKPSSNFTATLDYYSINMKDRVVLGNKIDFGTGDKQQFFINALNSKTSGIDFVLGYRGIKLGNNPLGLNLAGNYTIQNEADGAINNIPSVLAVKQTVFDETQNALTFTSRPKFKIIGGVDLNVGKFGIALNNTVFGPTQFKNADLYDKKNLTVEFLTKSVTDLGLNFQASEKTLISFNINNILNVLPEWKLVGTSPSIDSPAKLKNQLNDLTFNNRYSQMTYDGSHFSQLGITFNGAVSFKF
jgi:iron complex outermembrane recepter protein